MDTDRLASILDFLGAAEKLKDTLRTAYTSAGKQESSAEHSWRLCLMVILFEGELEGINMLRLLKLCIVHDLGEAVSGDIPAVNAELKQVKAAQERYDMQKLCEVLPDDQRTEMLALWEEYEAGQTDEAVLAKGFDKLETILQHTEGRNPANFDYGFNLQYGRDCTDQHPLLKQIRWLLDHRTRSRIVT